MNKMNCFAIKQKHLISCLAGPYVASNTNVHVCPVNTNSGVLIAGCSTDQSQEKNRLSADPEHSHGMHRGQCLNHIH